MARPTIESMVEEVKQWLLDAPEENRQAFINMPAEDLGMNYHHSLGMQIRNHFGLWNYEWEPQIKDGVDCSPEHPDALSMQVMKTLWKSMQEE